MPALPRASEPRELAAMHEGNAAAAEDKLGIINSLLVSETSYFLGVAP